MSLPVEIVLESLIAALRESLIRSDNGVASVDDLIALGAVVTDVTEFYDILKGLIIREL